MDRNFALEFVRVTEAAALSCARYMGRGDETLADHAAVEAMRQSLNSINFTGTVVIGEGERDEAPMLYIGEKVGNGKGPIFDLALDPLEGTTICALGGNNALAVIAIAEQGRFLHAPDIYMEKISVGPEAVGVVDLNKTPTENLQNIADAKNCHVDDLTVVILDRPRHEGLIAEVRAAGARIWLIGDGDVSAAIATCMPDSGVDVLMGTGGAPEGVIAAAALRCVNGDFQGRLVYRNEKDRERSKQMGIEDLERIYGIRDLADGPVMFSATGVTSGTLLSGVHFMRGGAKTHSLVMRSESGTIRFIEAEHHFDQMPTY
ncbi:MAG: class II fructose-bisphosphatase [Candidatus Latescibacteria bacterium]|nr:class II fructose-bisphosphatase [Candidatus Latescibacterota bacterium]